MNKHLTFSKALTAVLLFIGIALGQNALAQTSWSVSITMVQIIDMLGRVLVECRDAMHCVSTTGMTPGVYVLRLINGENVKIQKIVVK